MNAKEINLNKINELTELELILKKGNIVTLYQPIVTLNDGKIIGYEALSRGPKDSNLKYPDRLFEEARKQNKIWELELLCRVKAIQRANKLEKNKFLFINVDPHIFRDKKFEKGLTKEFLSKNNISSENIIFEITEKTAIEDYYSFKEALNNYVEQGFKIAIDDTGAGYSGLKTITETRPHFIKIDMDLIRNINKDTFKQALLEAFVKLANVTNMKLIAEGIETEEELATLINLGVYGGQGYFIKKPHINMDGIPKNVIDKILKYDKLKNIKYKNSKVGFIGEIARIDSPYKDDTKCIEIKNLFDKTDTTGACIVDKNNYPIGIIMKHYIDSFFSKPCGNAIYQKELAKNIMDKKPLVVDYYSGILDVSNIAMSRKTENVYDYVIVTKESKYYGVVTIRSLLHYTTMVESDYARQLNPLTGLPGNSLIDQVLYDICKSNNKYTILYFDLDNFKIYNDNYGFEQGDKIIKYTSNLIKYQANSIFPFDGFLGHIGGDDFIYIIEEHLKESYNLGENILEEFDKNIKSFFSIDDVKMGYMEGLDRNFNKAKVPITSLSIAGIYGSFNKVEDIGTMVSNIKKRVKKIKGSYYSIDKINN